MDSFVYIDQSQVKSLALLSVGNVVHQVDIPDGAQAVFLRRRMLAINPMNEQLQHASTIHCIGWKRGEDAVYLFIRDDGSTLLTNDLQAV
jgi:hypothetical protein